MSMEVILGGLIGSIVTVLLTKIFELIQKSKEHKYYLRKLFFEKKLQSAEAAVAEWYSASSSLFALAKLYELMSTEGRELDEEVFEQLEAAALAKLKEIERSTTNQISNSVFLYFDIDTDLFLNENTIGKIYTCFSEIKSRSYVINNFIELRNQKKETESGRILQDAIDRIRDEAKPLLSELASLYSKSQKDMTALLQKIRREMKKFES